MMTNELCEFEPDMALRAMRLSENMKSMTPMMTSMLVLRYSNENTADIPTAKR